MPTKSVNEVGIEGPPGSASTSGGVSPYFSVAAVFNNDLFSTEEKWFHLKHYNHGVCCVLDFLICEKLDTSFYCTVMSTLEHIMEMLLVLLSVIQNLTVSYSSNHFITF